ncbi:hypothetical protein [Kineobactrum salinum]|uniref:DUF4412 domain-containing protein n=1 Tax=Kineobactrum salinum TaxID=2708301 RepID=A0A6C0UBE3_9GAMM|nr:hypothetical protein [Kineobactrum salinum]QIB67374.1 hypothetical protein G3T16_20235 [Kineobactrum salinum]
MKITVGRAFCPALLGLALASPALHADVTEAVDQNGNTMTFEYEGEQLRINHADQQGYMVMRDDRIYVVNDADGELMVIDVSQAMSMFGGLAKSVTPDMTQVRVDSLEPTGRSETVAGIDGEVYILKYQDEDGKARETEMVLSSDRRAIGFRDAMHRMASSLARSLDQHYDASEYLQHQLARSDMGVLRYGADIRVTSITENRVDPARFVLPAEPTDLSGLGGMLGGGNADGESGGIMSGIFGGGNDKSQTEESGDSEESAGNAVENAGKEIGKAFGKLFGK